MNPSHRIKLALGLLFVALLHLNSAGCGRHRTPALQTMRRNNMGQILIGMDGWAKEHNNQLPPLAICDKNGIPLLSWRVALLPYLEQEALYAQFNLEEPWDGPSNRKLLDKMPPFFKLAGVQPSEPGFTHLRVFGASGLYPNLEASDVARLIAPSGKAICSHYSLPVPDGDDKTIFLVEATEAVPWTKPDVFRFDPADPPRLGIANPDYFLIGMLDGSVHRIDQPVDARMLAELVNPADTPRKNVVAAGMRGTSAP